MATDRSGADATQLVSARTPRRPRRWHSRLERQRTAHISIYMVVNGREDAASSSYVWIPTGLVSAWIVRARLCRFRSNFGMAAGQAGRRR